MSSYEAIISKSISVFKFSSDNLDRPSMFEMKRRVDEFSLGSNGK